MSVLKIQAFGGLVPRVSPRALPAGAAKRYENLLATSAELRPLPGDDPAGASIKAKRDELDRLGKAFGEAVTFVASASRWGWSRLGRSEWFGHQGVAAAGRSGEKP